MKITAIRIRVLRSRSSGYGHDACEIEAQVEEGDDPGEVAADIRSRCEAEVRQSAEEHRLIQSVDGLRSEVVSLERKRDQLKAEVNAAHKAIGDCEDLVQHAQRHGLKLPVAVDALALPF